MRRVRHQSTPRLKRCCEAPDGAGGGVSSFLTLEVPETGKRVKQRLVISVSTRDLSPRRESLSGVDALANKPPYSLHPGPFPDSENGGFLHLFA